MHTDADVRISRVSNDFTALVEFDATLSNHNRTDFLHFLFAKNSVFVANWTDVKLDEAKKIAGEKGDDEGMQEKTSTVAGYLVGLEECRKWIWLF